MHEVGIELDYPIEDVLLAMSLHVLDILYQVLPEEIDFIGVPMDLLSEGDAPDHRVDPFVRVVFCHLGEVEVQL